LLIECIPDKLAEVLSEVLTIPTVGIGAGVHCDGQVLVTHDLLGMFDKFTPKFVKKYADLSPVIKQCVGQFDTEVKEGNYPGPEHSFSSKNDYRQLMDE